MDRFNRDSMGNVARLFAFALLAIAMLFVTSSVMVPIEGESIGVRCYYAEKSDTLDMLYVGGSVCIVSWEPYEAWNNYGIASYALGKSSLSAYNVKPLVQEALKSQDPRLLVVDLRPFQYFQREVSLAADIALQRNLMTFSSNRMSMIDNIFAYDLGLSQEDTEISFFFDLIRSHGNWRTLTKDSFVYAFPGTKTRETKGFYPIRKYRSVELNDNSWNTGSEPVVKAAEDNFRDFLDYLSPQDRKVLFVVAPHVETQEQRNQYNYLSKIIYEYGFDYINFNDKLDELGVDASTDFYNDDHMNIFGAEKYTEWLASYVQNRYDLPDRRDDPKYDSYDDDYDAWVAVRDQTKAKVQELIDKAAE